MSFRVANQGISSLLWSGARAGSFSACKCSFPVLRPRYYSSAPSPTAEAETKLPRPRRAMLYVPGSDEKKIKKSFTSTADALCYDLEDSVASNKKNLAREIVFNALNASEIDRAEKLVRINSLGTGLEDDDLEVILASPRLRGLVLPKITSAEQIRYVDAAIDRLAPEHNRSRLRIIASIESALAVMNLKEIANASPRLDALLFAAEDFCADTGIARTKSRKELTYARSAVVIAAKAYGLQAIDLVCVAFKDKAILEEECREGKDMGFDAKQSIHPDQVETIQSIFVPTEAEIQRATQILELNQKAIESGKGAFGLEGQDGESAMIDAPVILQAERVISKARAAGLVNLNPATAVPAREVPNGKA